MMQKLFDGLLLHIYLGKKIVPSKTEMLAQKGVFTAIYNKTVALITNQFVEAKEQTARAHYPLSTLQNYD